MHIELEVAMVLMIIMMTIMIVSVIAKGCPTRLYTAAICAR